MIWDWNKESCELIGLLHSELVFISCAKSWVTSCLGYITGSTLYCSCPVSWSKLNLEFRGYQCRNQQFLGGASFSTSVARRKTVVQLGGLGSAVSPPQRGPGTKPQKIFGYFAFWTSSKHRSRGSVTMNSDESLHQKSTLLRVWRSEFGIPNWYTGFKIALDMALGMCVVMIEN